ncbi:MAG: TolC family protein [Deltaproteobacteria bacterium]|nr:TolC family protein [Deltaproteobacteria bacterium]
MNCLLKNIAPVLLILSGCALYHPLPLTPASVSAALAPPEMGKVRILAKRLKHPILKPIAFDERDGLSPDEAAVLAVIANPGLRAVRDERGIAAAQLIQAGILPNPVLSLSMEHPTGGLTAGTTDAYGSQLDWEITSLITYASRKKAAAAKAKAVDLSVAWREWQVAQAARLHCLRLHWTGKKISLLEASRKDLLRTVKTVETAVAIGAKTGVDLAAAKAELNGTKTRLARMEGEREKERLALNRAAGFPPGRVLPIEDVSPSTVWLEKYGTAQPRPERSRLDLIALRMGYESREAELRAAVLSQFPKIGIGLIHARDTGDVITTGPAVTFEFPLFDRNRGRIALEQATRKKLFDEYTARVFEARSEIAGIMKMAKNLRTMIELGREAIRVQRHLVRTYGAALNQGNADILSYYGAANRLREKELELADLQEKMTDLGVALESALGRPVPLFRKHRPAQGVKP